MKSMMDDAVAAEALDAQLQAMLDFHDVFGTKTTKRMDSDAQQKGGGGEGLHARAAKVALDVRKMQKLASIRDIMSRERGFDANARAASFRCILGQERELSLENFLDAVDEFDGDLFEADFHGDLFEADFHVPTIEPTATSLVETSPQMIPMDVDEDERSGGSANLFAFPASPGGRSARNADANFNPFEDIDKRLKALREARIQMKMASDDSSRGDMSFDNVPKSTKSQKSKLSITSLRAESVVSSGSDESSELPIAAPPMRRRSSTSTKASTFSHESFGAPVPPTPSRSGPRKIQRGVGASEVIKRHLEKRNRKEVSGLSASHSNVRIQSDEANAKIQEIISKRLDIMNRRAEPDADIAEHGPSVAVRTTRRFATRRSTANNDATPSSSDIVKALDVLTKHLESRLQVKNEQPKEVSPPHPASPSRRRRTLGARTASDSHDRVDSEASKHKLSLSPELDGPPGAPPSPRRSARRTRTKSSELTDIPNLGSLSRAVKSQESPEPSGPRPASPSRRRTRAATACATPKAEPVTASAKSHAAQVIKEHLERLQMHSQNKEAFQAITDWANDNTTERTEDPFCLDNVSVPISVAARNLAVPDMSDTDATTSERSEDPFQMSVGSGMSHSRQSVSGGMSPRRKPTSRRVSTSNGKGSSSRIRGSRAPGSDAMMATSSAATTPLELPSLPEMSEDEASTRHHRSVGVGEAADTSCRPRRPRERSASPSKRAQMEMAALAALF